ncbi:MAG: hypothetical protein ACLFUA_07100 [Spirochaetales bacterium]
MKTNRRTFTTLICSTVVLVLFGCTPAAVQLEDAGEMPDDEFLKLVEPHLAEGESISDISTVPPEPGYLSEAEVLKRVAQDFAAGGRLDLEYRVNLNGTDVTLDQTWLLDTSVHVPITVHNFNPVFTADTPRGYDYYYVLHASHPEIGTVFTGVYGYNENTGRDFGYHRRMGPAANYKAHEYYSDWDATGYGRTHIVTRKQASEFFSRTVGKPLRGEPIAVHYPWDGPMSESAFQWYFETNTRSAGAAEGYLMDALISMQSTADLDDPLSYMQRVNANYRNSDAVAFAGSPLPTLISKLPEPLGLYDAVETQSRQAHPQPLCELVDVRILSRDDFLPVQ